MSRILRRRPSPALFVAVVALVAALAGTAIAGPGASSSKITKAKVKKVANKQINKQKPWETGDIADGAVTTAKLAAINTRTATTQVQDNFSEQTASCDSGERVLSGGVDVDNNAVAEFSNYLFESRKEGEGWYARAYIVNLGGAARTWKVEAYCLAG